MGEWCKNYDKIMKDPELTHCSDECLMEHVKKSESGQGGEKSAEYWMEESDPWK